MEINETFKNLPDTEDMRLRKTACEALKLMQDNHKGIVGAVSVTGYVVSGLCFTMSELGCGTPEEVMEKLFSDIRVCIEGTQKELKKAVS